MKRFALLSILIPVFLLSCIGPVDKPINPDNPKKDTIAGDEIEQPDLEKDTIPLETDDNPAFKNYIQIADGALPALMKPDSRIMPLISAHRGGRNLPGLPENSIEAFQYVLENIPTMIECDVNISADGVLLLMHDNTLDRTTTGSGQVQQSQWSEMKDLKLKDDFGKVSDFSIPLLEDVLKWAKGKVILSLDVKRNVPFKSVVDMVEEFEMEDYVVIITYNQNDALTVNRFNKDLMISVSIRNEEEWLRMKTSGLPIDRMVAFTGTRLAPKALFDTLKANDIPAILGTLGNLDKQAESRGDSVTYNGFLDLGVAILATDRPLEAGRITESRK